MPVRAALRGLIASSCFLGAWLHAAPAVAEERLDHRGQYGLVARVLYEHYYLSARERSLDSLSDPGGLAEVAASLPISAEGGSLLLGARGGGGAASGARFEPFATYRGYAGYERWKTFLDAGLGLRIEPALAPTIRVGAGVQADLTAHLGLFTAAGASFGYGGELHVGLDIGLGVQVRFGTPGA